VFDVMFSNLLFWFREMGSHKVMNTLVVIAFAEEVYTRFNLLVLNQLLYRNNFAHRSYLSFSPYKVRISGDF
jgi:hypothetical protein